MSFVRSVELSQELERGVVRGLQGGILLVFAAGVLDGNAGVALNAGIGLFVTLLPAILQRRLRLVMSVGIVLWITLAMFLHALGTLHLPGHGVLSPYSSVWWWDHVTHALSSTLVAGVAYAVTRALSEHTAHIRIPPRFTFAYLLVFVMAVGVLWELLEFYVGVAARLVGAGEVLIQFSLHDTVLDLVYNTVGAVVVAVFGTVYLAGLADQGAALLDRWSAER